MAKTHEVTLLVTGEKKIVSTPDCKLLDITVGDTLSFISPHGTFDVKFPEPHVFSTNVADTNSPSLTVVRAGKFSGACRVFLVPSGEKIEAGAGTSYGLDGQSSSGGGSPAGGSEAPPTN